MLTLLTFALFHVCQASPKFFSAPSNGSCQGVWRARWTSMRRGCYCAIRRRRGVARDAGVLNSALATQHRHQIQQ
ncbi:hypothetical protein PoB_000345800 [Plakobranchus ocellatus]|uniref:Secreted protein n=1 Tax=Plakobranchus ocellatus TaxID=259542 RepID=A0AAV3Y2Z0_9GAST|nr:hypothetical protein PoB_000345800 [Plakobranchus ocellatus]